MEKTLKDFAVGETGTVVKITGDGKLRRRLMDMGVTPSAVITLCRTAPLGDPLEVTVRGYSLTLRKAEAELVIMKTE